jgi:hypothetical protein
LSLARLETSLLSIIALSRAKLILPHCALVFASCVTFLSGGAFAFNDLAQVIGRQALNLRLLAAPDHSPFYMLRWGLFPNLPVDLFGMATGNWLGPEGSVNAFVVLTIILLYGAVQSYYHSIHHQTSLMIGCITVIVINSFPLHFGFVNYLFGTGVMFLLLAEFEKEFQRPTGSPGRMVMRTVLPTLCWACSTFPVILLYAYGSARLAYQAHSPSPKPHDFIRRFWSVSARYLPGLVVLLPLVLINFEPQGWGDGIRWSLSRKLSAFVRLIQTGPRPVEEWLATALMMTPIVAHVLGWRWRIAPALIAPLVAIWGAFCVLPYILRGVPEVDTRLLPVLVIWTCAVISVTARPARPWQAVTAALLLGLAVARSAVTWSYVDERRPWRDDMHVVLAELPDHARLISRGIEFDEAPLWWTATMLPVVELKTRAFWFPWLFPNYFVKFRPEVLPRPFFAPPGMPSLTLGSLASLSLEELCATATHVVNIGPVPGMVRSLPLVQVKQSGRVTLFAVRFQDGHAAGPACPRRPE